MASFADTAIVFDLDGTLVDTAPDLVRTLNHVLTAAGCEPVPLEAIRPTIAFGARRMILEGLARNGRKPGEADVDRLLDTFLAHYADNLAVESRPFPGVVAVLERLTADGALVGVCTNKREDLSIKLLGQLDLKKHFGAIVGRDTLPVSKPHPGHLTGTVGRLGGRIERALMVGDSAVDIETAKAAGVPVVAVTFGYTEAPVETYQPDRTIDHYDDFLAAAEALLAVRAS